MAAEDFDQMRTNIWDYIYRNGPQSVTDLASEMEISSPNVVGLVDHAWFSIIDDVVGIATDGE